MDRFQYLLVLGACVAITLPLELGPTRFGLGARVWRRPRRMLLAVAPGAIAFLLWDVWATHHGTWSFADRYTIGVTVPSGMVIEELAFFVVVPVCGLLTLVTVRRMLGMIAARRDRRSGAVPAAPNSRAEVV